MACASTLTAEDPYLWLEEVDSPRASQWAREFSNQTQEELSQVAEYRGLYEGVLEVLQSQDRLAMPQIRGAHIYNFWTDNEHIRGIWRRASIDSYNSGRPDWEVLLDLDQLAKEEGENWVWDGATCLYPGYQRCLISLSRGGGDASVIREFDIGSRTFVQNGFALPESKSGLRWLDQDRAFLMLTLEPDQVTSSGYSRQVRLWTRGTPYQEAPVIFSGEVSDLAVSASTFWDQDRPFSFVYHFKDFFTSSFYWVDRESMELHYLPIPSDASLLGLKEGQLLVQLKSDWQTAQGVLPQGALLAGDLKQVLAKPGEKPVFWNLLFTPTPNSSLSQIQVTSQAVVGVVLEDVVGKLRSWQYQPQRGEWMETSISTPGAGNIHLVSSESNQSLFYASYSDFLRPSSVLLYSDTQSESQVVSSTPEWFDAQGMRVEQHFALSSDGERVPYFLVMPKGFKFSGQTPTLLYGYGGFEVSLTPFYSGVLGRSWLERGGAYVLANIRGGGEYGPRWHQAALKLNRQRAFDDFYAVAEDLMAKKVTSPKHLGIMGGSNGGLLVGVALTQRPDLFGAAISDVPLLDMLRYHLLEPGSSWMAEYGNPEDPEEGAFLRSYSPYHNIRAEESLPPTLFYTSSRDDRVHPGHARKMAAKMRDMGLPVWFFENQEGGHGGAANSLQSAQRAALMYSFLLQNLRPAAAEGSETTTTD